MRRKVIEEKFSVVILKITDLINSLVKIEFTIDVMKDFSNADPITGCEYGFAVVGKRINTFYILRSHEERV